MCTFSGLTKKCGVGALTWCGVVVSTGGGEGVYMDPKTTEGGTFHGTEWHRMACSRNLLGCRVTTLKS